LTKRLIALLVAISLLVLSAPLAVFAEDDIEASLATKHRPVIKLPVDRNALKIKDLMPKPGYGLGDNNHEHYGPPGKEYSIEKPISEDTPKIKDLLPKPGYGLGDMNHEHYGPPGKEYSIENPFAAFKKVFKKAK